MRSCSQGRSRRLEDLAEKGSIGFSLPWSSVGMPARPHCGPTRPWRGCGTLSSHAAGNGHDSDPGLLAVRARCLPCPGPGVGPCCRRTSLAVSLHGSLTRRPASSSVPTNELLGGRLAGVGPPVGLPGGEGLADVLGVPAPSLRKPTVAYWAPGCRPLISEARSRFTATSRRSPRR